MRTILAFSIIFSAIPAFGQNHFVGAKGGLNLTNIVIDGIYSNSDFKTGFTGGVTYAYQFENGFTLGSDLVYAQKGYKKDFIFTDESGSPIGMGIRTYYNYNYLSLPLKAGYSIGDKFQGFLNLGVVPSLLMNAKTRTSATEELEAQTYDATYFVTKFDFGALIEIGGSYAFEQGFSLFTAVAYQRNFVQFTNENYFLNWPAWHQEITVTVGVKYALKTE